MKRPYRLITTDDPDKTLGEGDMRYYKTVLAAANAMVKSPAPFKTIIFDDGCVARDLDDREQQMVEHVCGLLGYDLEDA
jgi:hypothetical protein